LLSFAFQTIDVMYLDMYYFVLGPAI
jgi:hypothetical protein